jgi:hypothetical protein
MKEKTECMFPPSVCKASSSVDRPHVDNASYPWWIVGGSYRDLNFRSEDNNDFIN